MLLRQSWKTSKRSFLMSQKSAHHDGSWAARELSSGMLTNEQHVLQKQVTFITVKLAFEDNSITFSAQAGPVTPFFPAEGRASSIPLRTRPWKCPPPNRWTSRAALRPQPLSPSVSPLGSTSLRWSSKPTLSWLSAPSIYEWTYDPWLFQFFIFFSLRWFFFFLRQKWYGC